jgi:DNA polymerase
MKALPQDLDGAAMVLRLATQKDKVGSALVRTLSKPKKGYYDRRAETLERVYAYCLSDVSAELEAHDVLGWLPDCERELWLYDQLINERGVCLDAEFITAAQRIVDDAAKPLLQEFASITGGLKPTQGAKFLAWLHGQGVHLDNMKAETLKEVLGDDEDGEELENELPDDLPRDAARALRIRQLIGSASVKKLRRMDQVVCSDSRARGLLQWHGTAPGRSAGRLFQPQNFPRGTVKVDGNAPRPEYIVDVIKSGDYQLVESLIGPATETVVSSLRHAIIAPKGKVLIAGDYAGIQARVVLAVSGQHDKTAIMAAGLDIYCDMATAIYKKPINKKEHPEERHTGKNSVLGLGFGMGADKFLDKYCKDQPLEFAQRVVTTYRKEWAPKVPYLWYGLSDAAVRCVWDRTPKEAYGVEYRLEDGWLTARVPSGHKIWYRNPQPVKRTMPWSTEDEPDIRSSFTFQAQKMGQWKTIDAFGGLLTENVVMRIEVDIKNNGMKNLEAAGFPVILDVHDELVCEVDECAADEKLFEECMLDQPQWVRDMQVPVAVETWTGGRYKK